MDEEDDIPADLDYDVRDPKDINAHLKVNFDDVLAEPDGTQSVECVWKTSYFCYKCSKNCCYNFCAVFTGIFVAFFWGCEFAVMTFSHVWCMTPGMRVFIIQCNQCQKCFGTITNCCVAPICEACGLLFSGIMVFHHGDTPAPAVVAPSKTKS